MERFLLKRSAEEKNDDKGTKKIRSLQKYRREYSEEWPCLTSSSKSNQHAFCTICIRDFSIAHGGKDDCRRHILTKMHEEAALRTSSNKSLDIFMKRADDENAVTRAEMLFTSFIMEHNLPISCADHAAPLFKKMFPDSNIAKKYGCGRTKTTAILKTMAASTQNNICDILRSKPFSLATDGSTDNNAMKIYPLVVSYFNEEEGRITTAILSLLECTNNTGEGIFRVIDDEFKKRNISWLNCVAFACDNAKTMTGHFKGVISCIKEINPNVNLQGCTCHLLHIAAMKGCKAFAMFNVEQFLVDIFYYLDKSSKRQHSFKLCQDVFGLKPHKILKYISTRWLSLCECIGRVLEQWEALKMFFGEGKDEENSKYLKIRSHFENPLSKGYLLFLKNVLPLFVSANVFLQQGKPLIHQLHKEINDLFFGLIVRFVKPSVFDESKNVSLININYEKKKYQKSDNDLVIGGETRSYLKSISEDKVSPFYQDVRNFYTESVNYIKKKLPIDDTFLKHAAIADITVRKKMSYASLEFLVSKFPNVLSDDEKNNLEEEFSLYQFQNFDFESSNADADTVWYKISQMCDCSGKKKFAALSKLIFALLLVPQSNSVTERVFSLVRKNQTDFRPTLGTETLTSLLIEKQNNLNSNLVCYNRTFSEQQIKAAKKATSS